MLVFPQLSTGCAALYPVIRKSATRTVVNDLGDGSRVVFGDPDAETTEWELRCVGLTLEESTEIDALFQAVSGRLATFTFLDPAGNLLLHSEEFGQPGWTNGALIQLTPGVADPLGTARATHVVNAASVAGLVGQPLAVPGSFRYVLSVWAKGTGTSNLTLSATTEGGSVTRSFPLTGEWTRLFLEVGLGLNTDSVTFGAQLDAGAAADLFGMQVEAQPGVSDYKQTGGSGGVYSQARFAEDELTVTARATDVFDAVVRIAAT
jgi:hypothetical protein